MPEPEFKKYVVRLSAEERETLASLIHKGKHPAARVLKARILLKADISEAGEGWSDGRIAKTLDTSLSTVFRTRQRLVEEGFEAVLNRKHSPNSARRRIFDGAAEPAPAKAGVTDRHTALDYARLLKELSDEHLPNAARIVLVQDNLNTHKPASLYEAFPAAEARRLVERFEWHYTPKHGSWLDLAESELSVLSSQCPDRRIPDKQTLTEEVAAWQAERNKKHAKADWQFTTADARVRLKRLYPSL
jgi:uncharacterized small protein (DUF1192 family)/DNA-binding MarR family transcriptional regulator